MADGEHVVPLFQPLGRLRLDGMDTSWRFLQLEDRQVPLLVQDAVSRHLHLRPVAEPGRGRRGIGDHMVVGHEGSRGVDDKTASQPPLAPQLIAGRQEHNGLVHLAHHVTGREGIPRRSKRLNHLAVRFAERGQGNLDLRSVLLFQFHFSFTRLHQRGHHVILTRDIGPLSGTATARLTPGRVSRQPRDEDARTQRDTPDSPPSSWHTPDPIGLPTAPGPHRDRPAEAQNSCTRMMIVKWRASGSSAPNGKKGLRPAGTGVSAMPPTGSRRPCSPAATA